MSLNAPCALAARLGARLLPPYSVRRVAPRCARRVRAAAALAVVRRLSLYGPPVASVRARNAHALACGATLPARRLLYGGGAAAAVWSLSAWNTPSVVGL